jgi:hypothetical protein
MFSTALIWTLSKSDFLNSFFTISRPQFKRRANPGAEDASAAACAIGAFVGLHG